MKKLVLILGIIFFAITGTASDLLQSCFDKAASIYKIGFGNNGIEYDILPHISFFHEYPEEKITQTPTIRYSVENLLTECVFIKKGAYGDYISDEEQAQIVKEMTDFLWTLKGLRFYRIEYKTPIEDPQMSDCAMGISHANTLLIMRGEFPD